MTIRAGSSSATSTSTTDQPDKAIEAYTRSLALHPGDANLLTDLGVMYRNTGQKEKAIESFDKARELDPKHEPSRLNKGIVLLFDMNDPTGAIASWEELLRLNPEAKMTDGTSVREFIEQTQKGTGETAGQKITVRPRHDACRPARQTATRSPQEEMP